MIKSLFPILTTPDIARALGFYRDLLGGTVTYEFPGPKGQPAYVGLELGSSHLGIGRYSDGAIPAPGAGAISLWVYVEDCDGTVARLREAGATVVEEPADQSWGERTARVRDFDGNEVFIATAPAAAP